MKYNRFKEIVSKEMIKKGKTQYRKAQEHSNWDGSTPELEEVIFKDNFHLIVTFKDGTIKDIDAKVFMNDKRLESFFGELRDNIQLFQKPEAVSYSGIIWTDMADISARGLWLWGKEVGNKKVAIKKIAFPKIKIFPDDFVLERHSDEKIHKDTPHFHVLRGNEEIGEVFVGKAVEEVKIAQEYRKFLKNLKNLQKYTNDNAQLLTEIYNAKDGNKIKELAKQLPDTYE